MTYRITRAGDVYDDGLDAEDIAGQLVGATRMLVEDEADIGRPVPPPDGLVVGTWTVPLSWPDRHPRRETSELEWQVSRDD